jgi:hypothetical protein
MNEPRQQFTNTEQLIPKWLGQKQERQTSDDIERMPNIVKKSRKQADKDTKKRPENAPAPQDSAPAPQSTQQQIESMFSPSSD